MILLMTGLCLFAGGINAAAEEDSKEVGMNLYGNPAHGLQDEKLSVLRRQTGGAFSDEELQNIHTIANEGSEARIHLSKELNYASDRLLSAQAEAKLSQVSKKHKAFQHVVMRVVIPRLGAKHPFTVSLNKELHLFGSAKKDLNKRLKGLQKADRERLLRRGQRNASCEDLSRLRALDEQKEDKSIEKDFEEYGEIDDTRAPVRRQSLPNLPSELVRLSLPQPQAEPSPVAERVRRLSGANSESEVSQPAAAAQAQPARRGWGWNIAAALANQVTQLAEGLSGANLG